VERPANGAGEIALTVGGWPPAKNEAKSMLSDGHPHAPRVRALLEAAQQALAAGAHPIEHGEIALELVIVSPEQPPCDATNVLGGIGDVLEQKTRRGDTVAHLGPLAQVALFANDRQIRESEERGEQVHYRLRFRRR
jgi:hypothetical protein